ncbi:hypothetical protein EBX93_18125, partial [bacterium]|nr:hypothetical protein [bacterium]
MNFKSFRDKIVRDFPELEGTDKYQEILEKLIDLGMIVESVKRSIARDVAFKKLEETAYWIKNSLSVELIEEETLKEYGVCKGCTVSKAGCPAL